MLTLLAKGLSASAIDGARLHSPHSGHTRGAHRRVLLVTQQGQVSISQQKEKKRPQPTCILNESEFDAVFTLSI